MVNSVSCNAITLDYSVEGRGDQNIFVVGSSIYYPRTFSHQLKKSFKFIFADLPHFVDPGPAFDLASIGFDLYAECIDRIRTAAQLEQVVIVGHSHHGNVALEYAKRFPQYVSHVVLIGSPPANIAQTMECAKRYWYDNASDHRKALLSERRKSLDGHALHSLPPQEAYIRQYVADAPLYWYEPEYDAAWLWQGMRFRMEAIQAFRNLYENYEMQWDAESMEAPVLVVMGLHDYAVPHTLWASDRAPASPNMDMQLFERSGHTPQLEQADEFDNMLLKWLNETGPIGR